MIEKCPPHSWAAYVGDLMYRLVGHGICGITVCCDVEEPAPSVPGVNTSSRVWMVPRPSASVGDRYEMRALGVVAEEGSLCTPRPVGEYPELGDIFRAFDSMYTWYRVIHLLGRR